MIRRDYSTGTPAPDRQAPGRASGCRQNWAGRSADGRIAAQAIRV